MVALANRQVSFTLAEYLAFENGVREKHEYWNGEICAMAGGTRNHAMIAANVLIRLGTQLHGRPCAAYGSDQRIHIAAADVLTYPDVVVSCPPHASSASDPYSLLDATVIVEVLSRSTAQYDHGAKFQAYELLPSLRHYVLTEQDRAEVEVWSRNGPKDDWEAERHDQILDVAPLGAIGCLLKVEEIYERINF